MGREAICEVMIINAAIRELIAKQASYRQIKDAARANGMVTLFESGLQKVQQGITSLEEVMSMTLGEEI
jgi:Type II secretory pathway, ATPase PulE/Tfp pilus assembly pathway, ATPase PilB